MTSCLASPNESSARALPTASSAASARLSAFFTHLDGLFRVVPGRMRLRQSRKRGDGEGFVAREFGQSQRLAEQLNGNLRLTFI